VSAEPEGYRAAATADDVDTCCLFGYRSTGWKAHAICVVQGHTKVSCEHADACRTWKLTKFTESMCPRRVCLQRTALRSHTLTVLSIEALAKKSPV